MSKNRKIDAAIGLLGLGRVYPHTFVDNNQTCSLCGNGAVNEVICYSSVPNFGTSIDDASDLLAGLMKDAPYGIDVTFNKLTNKYVFIYKGKEFKEDKIFKSSTAPEGIRQIALYHYKININQVCDTDTAFNIQV
jgi:hypothetical protein